MDNDRKGFVDSNSIKRFLTRMGHQVLPQELVAIVRRLDIDGDSKIGYHEFIESMTPVSPDMIPIETVMDRDNQVFLDQSSLA